MGKEIVEGAHEKLAEALRWASDMVGPTGYAAGTDHITLADLCFLVGLQYFFIVFSVFTSKISQACTTRCLHLGSNPV